MDRTIDVQNAELISWVKSDIVVVMTETKMKLDALSKRYIEELQNKNPATISNLKRVVTFFSSWDPAKITSKHAMDYVIDRRGKEAKPATINREITIMKQFFGWLVKNSITSQNPAQDLKYEKLGTPRTRWITVEEELHLIGVSPLWLQQIIILATSTGLRRGELLNLTWDYVDLDQRILTVAKSKNGEPRVVPLTKRAMEVLSELYLPSHVEYVFICQDLKPISPDTLEYYFRLAVKQAELKEVRFHTLRHTCASRLVQGGTDIYVISKLLGHKSIQMSARYSHLDVNSLRRALEKQECPEHI